MRRGLVSLLVVVACFQGALAFANGYKILCVKSAKATAMGEAFIVQADDPTAVAFNPAGLAQLRDNQINLHATVCNGYTEHESPDGVKTDNEDSWQAVPSFFITSDLGQENMAVGLGVSLPNGLSSEWAEDSFARYVATYSDLIVADISPAVGVSVSDKLMVGAGVNFYYSEAQLESMIDYGALSSGTPNGMDISSKLEGDGTAWGANVGAIYSFTDKHSVGLTYRLPFTVDYDGDTTIAGSSTDIEASIDFPEVIVAGYAFRPNDKWTFEVNLDWTHWDDVDDISIDMSGQTITQEQDMRNTVAYKFGSEYKYSDKLALRCGYIYNENATEEEAWRPSLQDTDTHFFTAGLGYNLGKLTLDTAVQIVYYETRTIDNNVDYNEYTSTSSIDGTYRTWAPCVSVAANYRF